jgi:signal peptidase I
LNFPEGLNTPILDAAVALLGEAGRTGEVRVLGESMRPTLPPGSVLHVEFAPGAFRRGDLLLFRQADYLAVHRFLGNARYPDGRPCLRTRGDNVIALDPPVDRSRVVGRALALRRDGVWRDLTSRRARAYAALLAFHDLAFAAAAVAADRTSDRVFRKLRVPLSFRRVAALLDNALLRAADRLLFRVLNAPAAAPGGVEERP